MTDGNVTLNVSVDPLVAYPVGSIYMSVNSTNPSQLFGGTWEALNQGRVLIGAGTSYPAGSIGGEATHTLTTDEMPSHSHSGSSDTDGSHSHTRGSMEIVGSTDIYGYTGWTGTGAISVRDKNINNKGNAGNAYGSMYFNFTASNSWSGSTSSSGSHWHYISTNSVGGGSAHNNMQPYLSVYMWKRTA